MPDVFRGAPSSQQTTGLQERYVISNSMRRALVLCLVLPLLCVSAAAETVIISVDSTNLRFTPSEVTITEGDEVRFFWSGQALPHNAVANDGFFDTGEPERAVDHTVEFPVGTNGTYDFVCEPHESVGMVGTITVEPAPPVEVEARTRGARRDPAERGRLDDARIAVRLCRPCATRSMRLTKHDVLPF